MIWDYIRDFLVQYIFGGVDSNLIGYTGFIGKLGFYVDGSQDSVDEFYTTFDMFKMIDYGDGSYYMMSIGDWLSTTTTIIIMCVIVFLFALLVRWVFKAVTSAFLLK